MIKDELIQTPEIKIPTDEKLAQTGYKQLLDVAEHLAEKDPNLLSKMRTIGEVTSDMLGLFLGTNPEVSLEFLTKEEMEELAKSLQELQISNIAVIKNDVDERTALYHPYSFVNLAACSRVFEQNPDLFPKEAVENPETWLTTNKHMWLNTIKDKTAEKRYGLLSGYPRSAVDNFTVYSEARGKIRGIKDKFDPTASSYIRAYVLGVIRPYDSPEHKTYVKKLLEHTNLLTEQEINLLLIRFGIDTKTQSFVGFSEEDKQWGDRMDAIVTMTVSSKEAIAG